MPYASPFAPAQVDFSAIGNLADTYYNAKEGAMKRQAFEEDRANTRSQRGAASARQARLQEIAREGFPKDAQGNPDYAAAAARLYEVGEFDKAQQLLGLADKRTEQADTRTYRQNQLDLQRRQLEQGGTTDKIRNYKFYSDQERSSGREPLGFQEYFAQAGGDFGKTGTIVQGKDGKFFSVQFGSDGSRRIEPLELPGGATTGDAPASGTTTGAVPDATPLTPARGVTRVGNQLIDNATGRPVADASEALRGEAIAKGEGENIANVRAGLPQAQLRLEMVTGGLDRLEKTAKGLAAQPGLDKVAGGLYEAYAPNVSEGARNAQTELENLKVKISGVVLQAMRDASKTGGAVGQVTEREWPRLENMLANLDPRQGEAQFRRNLNEIVAYTQTVKRQLRTAYEADLAVAQGTPGAPPQPAAPAAPAAGRAPAGGGLDLGGGFTLEIGQ